MKVFKYIVFAIIAVFLSVSVGFGHPPPLPMKGKNLKLDTTNFDTNLNSTHDTVQKAIEALEESAAAGATALDDIGDPDANGSIAMAGYTHTLTTATDGWGGMILDNTTADNASDTTLLTLQFADANDANSIFLNIIEDSDGTPVSLFKFHTRTMELGTNATISGTGDVNLDSIDNYQVGGSSLNDIDIGFTVDQTMTGITESGGTGITIEQDAAAYLTINTANAGATTISQTSDGTDQIIIGDGVDRVDIASDSWDVTNGAFTGVTNLTMSGNLSLTSSDIIFTEQADHQSTPGTGFGYLWVKNTSPSTLIFTDDAGTDTTLGYGISANRVINKLDLTADTSITEAQILEYKYITNQGDVGEADLTLPAVSYPILVVFVVEEAQNIEINPPSGEAFDLNGTTLDANDCVDANGSGATTGTVGDKIAALRMQNAAGTWIWSLDTIRGPWTDTGASD